MLQMKLPHIQYPHPGQHIPVSYTHLKNAEPADYHAATGFEAMFGYLYLKGEIDRLRHLFSIICEESC